MHVDLKTVEVVGFFFYFLYSILNMLYEFLKKKLRDNINLNMNII